MAKNDMKRLAESLGATLLDDIDPVADPISTGCKAFDFLLQGGIPSGLITEFVGDFSTGKSLLGLQICRECINSRGIAVLIDSENSINSSWATEILKVDSSKLIYYVAPNLEATYKFLFEAVQKFKRKIPSVIVWDSIAATPPAVVKGEAKGSDLAVAARVNSKLLPTLLSGLRSSGTGLVLINQLRSKIGVLFGQKWDSYGGRAIKFYSSLRVHIVRTGRVRSAKITTGTKGRAEIIKSRICRPFTYLDFTIDFEQGIPPWSGTLELFVKAGLVRKFGGKESNMRVFKSNSFICKFKSSQIGEDGVWETLWSYADEEKLLSALNIKE